MPAKESIDRCLLGRYSACMANEQIVSSYAAKGGRARASALTHEQRREIARAAATARWSREGHAVPVQATYGAPDRPLKIGEIEIPAYVLVDGRRGLGQRGLQT